MRYDSRLPRVLHVLLHLEQMDGPATSELIAKMLNANSSVVRRTMGGLRDGGYVRSTKGHGGGWALICPLEEITLLGLYEALGSPSLFALGESEDRPSCLMEQAANKAVKEAILAANKTFLEQLRNTTVAELVVDFQKKLDTMQAQGPRAKKRP